MSRQDDIEKKIQLKEELADQEWKVRKIITTLGGEMGLLAEEFFNTVITLCKAERFIREHGLWGKYKKWKEEVRHE